MGVAVYAVGDPDLAEWVGVRREKRGIVSCASDSVPRYSVCEIIIMKSRGCSDHVGRVTVERVKRNFHCFCDLIPCVRLVDV
jgi:hypothetical protein